jgi:5-methyltetrahydrofolate--homocysteine methyltransferase
MEPYGEFTETQVLDAFREQAKALVDAGANAIIIETQTSLEELRLGLMAAREAGAACVIGSMAYDVTLDGTTFRTMMGIDPERAASFMQEHGADIVALNCGTGMDMARARQAVLRYLEITDRPIMAQPNAGQPKLVDMKVVYDETPAQMVAGVVPLLQAVRPTTFAHFERRWISSARRRPCHETTIVRGQRGRDHEAAAA